MEEDPFAKLSITFVRVVMILGGETDLWCEFFLRLCAPYGRECLSSSSEPQPRWLCQCVNVRQCGLSNVSPTDNTPDQIPFVRRAKVLPSIHSKQTPYQPCPPSHRFQKMPTKNATSHQQPNRNTHTSVPKQTSQIPYTTQTSSCN